MDTLPLYRLNRSPGQLLLDLLRHRFGTTLTLDDLVFDLPVPLGGTRTRLPVSAPLGSALSGRGELDYDRLDLHRFFFGIPLNFRNLADPTEAIIRTEFESDWGVKLDPEEIDVTIYPAIPRHPRRVSIKAKNNALCWVGELEGWILPPGFLGDLFTAHPLCVNDSRVKKNAFLYPFESEITLECPVELVTEFPLGYSFTTRDYRVQALLRALQVQTEDLWCLEPGQAYWNLRGAKVIYHDFYDVESGDLAHHVIVIQLTNACCNLFGHLMLHYSLTDLTDLVVNPDLDSFT